MDTVNEYKTAAQTATYIDDAGNKQTGTLAGSAGTAAENVNGQGTVKAAVMPGKAAYGGAAGNGNGLNAGVQNTGAAYEANAGMAAPGTQGMSTADMYRQLYNETVNAGAAQQEAANAEAERIAGEQKAAQAEQYRNANRQAYSDYMHSVKSLPEQLAAYGITGGLAESSRVKLGTNYSGAVQANAQAQAAGEREINSQLAAQRYQAQAAADAGKNQALQGYYQAMIGLQQQKEAEDKARQEAAAQMLAGTGDYSGYVNAGVLTAEQAAALKENYAKNDPQAAAKAEMLAATGDYSGYVALGMMTPEEAAAMQSYWQKTNPQAQAAAEMLAKAGDYSGYVNAGVLTAEQAAAMQEQYGKTSPEAQARAEMLAKTGDYSGYVAMGLMSPEEAAAMQSYWKQTNPQAQARAEMLGNAGDYSGYVDMGILTPEQAEMLAGKYNAASPTAQAQAETLAGIGDYSGFVKMGILTPEQAAQMQKAWIAENGNLAKALGYVKATAYRPSTQTPLNPADTPEGKANQMTLDEYEKALSEAKTSEEYRTIYNEIRAQVNEGSTVIVDGSGKVISHKTDDKGFGE